MRTVYLHGALAEEYGPSFEFDVLTFGEAVRAMEANFPGFKRRIRAGNWYLSYGEHDKDEGMCVTEDLLKMKLGRGPIHFIPEAIGMGGGGRGKGIAMTVIGIVLVAVAFYFAGPGGSAAVLNAESAAGAAAAGGAAFTIGGVSVTYGAIALFGAALALSGIATLITSVPEAPHAADQREQADQRASFLFNGPVNTIEQGGPVPLVYGKHIVGSKVISGGIEVKDIS
jgi:predicted phage tail protein